MFMRSRLLLAFATAAVLASSVLARAQMDPDGAVDGADVGTSGVHREAVSAMQRIALFVATRLAVLALLSIVVRVLGLDALLAQREIGAHTRRGT